MRSRMIDFSSLSNASCALARNSRVLGRVLGSPAYCVEDLLLDGLGGVLALELVLDRGGLVELLPVRALDLLEQALVDLRRLDLELRALPAFSPSSRMAATSFLISECAMSSASRISASGISLAPASTIRMASSVPETTRSRSAREEVLLVRVDDEVAVDLADPHRADRLRERDVGDHQRRGGAVHREDVVGVDVVDRQRDRDELRLAVPALGEERAQRAVDHAGDERALLAGAALALEERAGDLARGVHALLDVHRQREEVDVTQVAGGRGAQHHRLAGADDDGAGGLLGHAAGLERDLGSADLDGDPMHFRHMFLSRPRVRCAGPLHLLTLRYRCPPW